MEMERLKLLLVTPLEILHTTTIVFNNNGGVRNGWPRPESASDGIAAGIYNDNFGKIFFSKAKKNLNFNFIGFLTNFSNSKIQKSLKKMQ